MSEGMWDLGQCASCTQPPVVQGGRGAIIWPYPYCGGCAQRRSTEHPDALWRVRGGEFVALAEALRRAALLHPASVMATTPPCGDCWTAVKMPSAFEARLKGDAPRIFYLCVEHACKDHIAGCFEHRRVGETAWRTGPVATGSVYTAAPLVSLAPAKKPAVVLSKPVEVAAPRLPVQCDRCRRSMVDQNTTMQSIPGCVKCRRLCDECVVATENQGEHLTGIRSPSKPIIELWKPHTPAIMYVDDQTEPP